MGINEKPTNYINENVRRRRDKLLRPPLFRRYRVLCTDIVQPGPHGVV